MKGGSRGPTSDSGLCMGRRGASWSSLSPSWIGICGFTCLRIKTKTKVRASSKEEGEEGFSRGIREEVVVEVVIMDRIKVTTTREEEEEGITRIREEVVEVGEITATIKEEEEGVEAVAEATTRIRTKEGGGLTEEVIIEEEVVEEEAGVTSTVEGAASTTTPNLEGLTTVEGGVITIISHLNCRNPNPPGNSRGTTSK